MRHNRITIAELILIVVVVAIGLAAIRGQSAAWAGAMLSITFFALICSLLGVALGRGPRRVYWSGFAVLGWSYLFLIYVPWLYTQVGTYLLAPNLFPAIDEMLHAQPAAAQGLQSVPVGLLGAAATGGGFSPGVAAVADVSDLVRIGIAMEALLWAFLGGWAARYFASAPNGCSAIHVPAPADSPDGRG